MIWKYVKRTKSKTIQPVTHEAEKKRRNKPVKTNNNDEEQLGKWYERQYVNIIMTKRNWKDILTA